MEPATNMWKSSEFWSCNWKKHLKSADTRCIRCLSELLHSFRKANTSWAQISYAQLLAAAFPQLMVTTFFVFRNATHRNCTQESSCSVHFRSIFAIGRVHPTHCPLPTSSVLKSSSLKPHQMQRGPPSAARWNCLPLTVTWYSNTQWVSQRSHSHIYYLLIKYCKCFKFNPTPFDAPGPALHWNTQPMQHLFWGRRMNCCANLQELHRQSAAGCEGS